MGQISHGSATATEAVRRALQRSEGGVRALARRYSISPTTVQKWRKREVHNRQADGAERTAFVGSQHRAGGGDRGIPAPQPAAIGRLSLCRSARDPASDAVVLAPCVEENHPPDRFLTLFTFNGTRYHGCPILKAICPPRRSSKPIRSGFSTSAALSWFACKP